jgi:glycosyltransferase involved in cell wall biosynthesis
MTAPRASIIITTYNRPERLRRAIASAFTAARDAEIIVVDDASSNETAQTCESIVGVRHVRVERNQGVAGARNVGLIASRGEFITFLDDDDLRLPKSLDDQIEVLSKSPAAMFCYAQAIPQDDAGNRQPPFPMACPEGDIFHELLTRNFIPCGTVVFRRECLARVGLLDDSIPRIDDWDLWLRITELFPVVSLKAPVMIWRPATAGSQQGSSDTVDVINLSVRHFRTTCLRLDRVMIASRRERQQAWRNFSTNVAEHLAWETFRCLCAGQLSGAFMTARTMLRLHPSIFLHLTLNWARASSIKPLLSTDLETAKNQLKEIRATPDKHENRPVQESPRWAD